MANNGHLFGSDCLTSIQYARFSCESSFPSEVVTAAVPHYYFSSSSGFLLNCGVGSPNRWVSGPRMPVYNCEIPGPPLTEVEQIQAINGLFPHAVAILAIAWGLRYIRVLVAEWLKERNASD